MNFALLFAVTTLALLRQTSPQLSPANPVVDSSAAPTARKPGGSQEVDLEVDLAAAQKKIRSLVGRGISDANTPAETEAVIAPIANLRTTIELEAAVNVLSGEADRPNLIASDARIRRALFAALAKEPSFGQVQLIHYAVIGDDLIRQSAIDALPTPLAPRAESALARYLEGDRELFINRAAMVGSAHASAALIPPLIAAQYAPPKAKRGDEAWIAIGKTINYIAGAVPVVGDESGAFQPIPGTIFEGSVLRIMESMVEIYRTEVHFALNTVVERSIGQPAPPFGYDAARWQAWFSNDFPRLAAAHAAAMEHDAQVAKTTTTKALQDG